MTRAFWAIWSVIIAAVLVGPVRAEGPEDTVSWIYTSLAALGPADTKGLTYLSAPANRSQYLSQRMVAFYDANDTYSEFQMLACVDYAFDVPGNDFNANEIAQSLTVTSTGDNQARSVTASFRNFGALYRVTYDFIAEEGYWKIDDITGPGYRVSQIDCKAKTALEAEIAQSAEKESQGAAYPGEAARYCYMTGGDTLQLDVAADGRAQFDVESVQGNGHFCMARGEARWTGVGWVYEETLDGGPCRLEFLITATQGVRLTDADWSCKPSLCGARAALDGLTFDRASQVDCVQMPAR